MSAAPVAKSGGAGPLAGFKLERLSTPDKIAEAIRNLILSGQLAPGTPLREVELGSILGVSRNTLREALRGLGQEGLVTHEAHRGVTVRRLDVDDVRDIFRVRQTLEMLGVESSSGASSDRLQALDELRVARDQAVDAKDWPAAFDADMRFHAEIVGFIGSARFTSFFVGLLRELRLAYHVLGGLETERLARDRRQHARIVRLIKAGDVQECQDVLLEHLAASEALLLKLLAKHQGQRPSRSSRAASQ